MEHADLQKQYDRFLSQAREEAKDLYWLFNFFFVIESALLGALFVGKIHPDYIRIAQDGGLILTLYWLIIVHKQRLWRNFWIGRIQTIEEALKFESGFQMWPIKEKSAEIIKDYIFGKRGLWRFLFCLPIIFALTWLILIFR